jgi:hypothetical protein
VYTVNPFVALVAVRVEFVTTGPRRTVDVHTSNSTLQKARSHLRSAIILWAHFSSQKLAGDLRLSSQERLIASTT